ATGLAADAEFEVGPLLSTAFGRDLHELTDAGLVDRGEWIPLHDFQLLIRGQERAGIIAAHAERGLRQVVGAEAEELPVLRDLLGQERAARHFNHRADEVAGFGLLLLRALARAAMDAFQ